MKIICYYNRNLKMSEGKLASQIEHVCKEAGRLMESDYKEDIIVVLKLSATKFKEKLKETRGNYDHVFIQMDLGLTEVDEGTVTAFGHLEYE